MLEIIKMKLQHIKICGILVKRSALRVNDIIKCLYKKRKFQIINISFHLKKLENEHITPKTMREKVK